MALTRENRVCKTEMSRLEIDAMFKFCSLGSNSGLFYPMPVADVLRKNAIIDEPFYLHIRQLQFSRCSNLVIFEKILYEIIHKCSLEHLIKVLYDNDFKELSKGLYRSYIERKNALAICRVHRSDTSNRQKLGEYFKHIKQQVHALCFNNPYYDMQHISNIMKSRIAQAKDPLDKMRKCDKYVALKAAEMDALTNVAGIVSKDHPGYKEISRYINSTTNPALTSVLLYGRQSDVVSTTGRFDEAEKLMKLALVNADNTGSCVEVTDMIYKNVVVKLSKFEKNPQDENLKQSILYEADRGLWTLEDEKEDLRIFWTKLFLLRMIFAHLGIGKFCDIIKNYVPTKRSLNEAERLLDLNPLKNLEHRRQMFIAVARARLFEWKGDITTAEWQLKLARVLAKEGKYAEARALENYEKHLSCKVIQCQRIPQVTPTRTEEVGIVTSSSSCSYPVSVSSERSYISTSEEQTDIKGGTDETELKLGVSFETSAALSSPERSESFEHLDPYSLSTNQTSSWDDADLSSINPSETTEPVSSEFEHLDPRSFHDSQSFTNTFWEVNESYPSVEHLRQSSFD